MFSVFALLPALLVVASGRPIPPSVKVIAPRGLAAPALPTALPRAYRERRQIGVSVLGFTTLSGGETATFAAEIAAETASSGGVAAAGTSGGGAPPAASSTSSSTAPASTGNSSSSSVGHDALTIFGVVTDLASTLSGLVTKSSSGGLTFASGKSILSTLESLLSGSATKVQTAGNLTESNGDLNATAIAEEGVTVIGDVLTITGAVTTVAPETLPIVATVDAGLTGLMVALQGFVDVEPLIAQFISSNATLEKKLENLGGGLLKVLGL